VANLMSELFYLGVDGGQSHTAAIVADGRGNILGRGRGGPSNHAEQPGGRERLRRAIVDSVGSALRAAGARSIANTEFSAAHCAMTGGADFKEEIIGSILRGRHLEVGHDAPAALAGATAAGPGMVVIAGTGSVAYGEGSGGRRLRVGGWGYLFGDEGGGFWIALQGIKRAMLGYDGFAEATVLGALALEHFSSADLQTLSMAVYRDDITRDRLATFATIVHKAAQQGDNVARNILKEGGAFLAGLARTVSRRLQLEPRESQVAGVGGVFRGELMQEAFRLSLEEQLPGASIVPPRFDPAIGALLLAYRGAGIERTTALLQNLETGSAVRG
jgi:N-acetylglucosamine kinase-like BadF-type ATPase